LARDPKSINALEVILAIDGPVILTSCFTEHSDCDQSESCTVREPLRKVHEGILDLLAGITITDMAEDEGQGHQDGCGPDHPAHRLYTVETQLPAMSKT
jgi:DNA-binding IscR family transcriptional regulator